MAVKVGSDGPVSVEYTTVAGTALAGTDFVATSGRLTFLPGEFIQNQRPVAERSRA
jgi:hypothetical protein